jgi:hypothetical protein
VIKLLFLTLHEYMTMQDLEEGTGLYMQELKVQTQSRLLVKSEITNTSKWYNIFV